MTRPTRHTIGVSGGELPAVTVLPEGEAAAPFALIVPSIFGVTDDLIEQMTELSTAGGIVAVDPFWRVEPGPIPYTELGAAFERVGALDRKAAYADVVAACGWIREQPRFAGRLIMVGICFGGPFCLLTAADGLIDGAVTWHGSRMEGFLDRVSEMRCPMHHHIGDADPIVPPPARAAIEDAFAGRDDVVITVHPGATHGFSHRGADARVESAEAAAMRSVVELLAR